MKMGNALIKKQFDDIDEKIEFMMELCQTLQLENKELILKTDRLEAELGTKNETEEQFSEQEALVQLKIDGLLTKLDSFVKNSDREYSSSL
jgi:regulator of replication initiation timing